MNRPIRVLLVEDSENDVLLLLRHLHRGGYQPVSKAVDSAPAMIEALEKEAWDIIISDYVVPGFGGLEALEVLKSHDLDLPFIIVSGQIGEDVAIKAMKAGAHDYVMKHNLSRLLPAVERELREAEMRRERRRSLRALQENEERFRQLAEQLRIRNEELVQVRDELESRVTQRTAALSKANAELRRQIEERKRLEKELLDITEQERQRIGIDLHDDLGQQLMGIAFMVKGLHQKLEAARSPRASEASKIHSLVCQSIQRAHDLALDLASECDGENLPGALEQLAQRVKNLFGVNCQLKLDADPSVLQPGVAAHFYKIAQEALTNAIKHGKSQQIRIHLEEQPDQFLLRIWNDGLPFNTESSQNTRMGLRIMNYRAHVIGASLDVRSDEDEGTVVTCCLPLPERMTVAAKCPQPA